LIEGDRALPAWVSRTAFLLQHAPFCNPFLTRTESTYLRSAAGYFRFFGFEGVTRAIDQILQMTVPDEDVVYILLQDFLLDDLRHTRIKSESSVGSILSVHERQHRQDLAIFRPGCAAAFEDPKYYDFNHGA
jgi:hypothetical protein